MICTISYFFEQKESSIDKKKIGNPKIIEDTRRSQRSGEGKKVVLEVST